MKYKIDIKDLKQVIKGNSYAVLIHEQWYTTSYKPNILNIDEVWKFKVGIDYIDMTLKDVAIKGKYYKYWISRVGMFDKNFEEFAKEKNLKYERVE